MRSRSAAALPLLCIALTVTPVGCRTGLRIPLDQGRAIAAEFEGKTLYLRSSLNVMPFFGDPTRRLVSPWPADSARLLESGRGEPILPGPVERLLIQGSRARIDKVELPTAANIAMRPPVSPRDSPWVYLSVAGERLAPRLVAVLPKGARTREELLAAFDQLFCAISPDALLANQPAPVREAIRQKRLTLEMDCLAVELAWGRPERIHQEWVEGVRVEKWTWALGRRSASFRDGRLTGFTP
jgi:hypothetical protein